MTTDQDLIRDTFYIEAQEILETLDALLLEYEKDTSSIETLNSIFRSMHTLKGSAGISGAHVLEQFTHIQEDLLDHLRSEDIAPTDEIIDLLFESLDMTKEIFELSRAGEEIDEALFWDLGEKIKSFLPHKEDYISEKKTAKDIGFDKEIIKGLTPVDLETIRKEGDSGKRVYQIIIRLGENSLREGIDPLLLIRRLRLDGTVISPKSDLSKIPLIKEMEPSTLYIDDIRFIYASRMGQNEVSDVFEFALEAGEINIHQFTSSEMKELFDVDADSFWLESSGKETWEEAGTAAPERILLFKKEIEEGMEAAKDCIKRLHETPEDAEAVKEIFRFFHTINGNSAMLGLSSLTHLVAPVESILESVRSGGQKITGEIIGTLDRAIISIERVLPEFLNIEEGEHNKRLGEILVEIGAIDREALDNALEMQQSPIGEILVKEGLTSREKVDQALRLQRGKGVKTAAAIKIDAERLDNLVDLVGELVIAQSLVAQDKVIKGLADGGLLKNFAQLMKITKNIQGHVMSMRMLPLLQTFQKMSRVVRDVSKKAGKEVTLKLFGEDTEVDKTAIDEIGDPLVHILRNSVDHGIETPEERKALGKPEAGTIELNAYHQGGNVVIQVKDDGKGLSREKILKKAIEKGLITDDAHLTDNQIYNLIFEPGFSTSAVVTEISGRGVGLDVVKRNMEKLRGTVDVVTAEGAGTTFTLKLPLTLAIIDGILVSVGNERYIVPTLSIESSLRPGKDDMTMVVGKGEMVNVRGNLLPVVRLHNLFNVKAQKKDPADAILVLVESEGNQCCLMVDDIIGHQQAVIKSLGEQFKGIQGVSGCTILGDGRVGLILDVSGIMKVAMG